MASMSKNFSLGLPIRKRNLGASRNTRMKIGMDWRQGAFAELLLG